MRAVSSFHGYQLYSIPWLSNTSRHPPIRRLQVTADTRDHHNRELKLLNVLQHHVKLHRHAWQPLTPILPGCLMTMTFIEPEVQSAAASEEGGCGADHGADDAAGCTARHGQRRDHGALESCRRL